MSDTNSRPEELIRNPSKDGGVSIVEVDSAEG